MYERALRLSRRLKPFGVLVGIGIQEYENNKLYLYLVYKDRREFGVNNLLSDNEIIELAKTILKPKYTKVPKACMDLLDMEVYIKAGEDYQLVNLVSINKSGLYCDRGVKYNLNELYLKE